jgi:two-component system phosphate regulon sensor histidine kinase PhoR
MGKLMGRGPGRFFWKLFTGNVLLLILVIGACVFLIAGSFENFYNEEQSNHLRQVGRLLLDQYGDAVRRDDTVALAQAVREITAAEGAIVRVTFISEEGRVLADSHAVADEMESHATRKEVLQARDAGIGVSTRYSTTIQKEMMYVALRVEGEGDSYAGVVRVAMPVATIVARTTAARRLFWRIALVILVAAIVLALGLAKMWSERIARVTMTARLLSQGDLTARADERGTDEVAMLARSLNRMRDHQTKHLETIERQRNNLEYLLAKLHEGVIAADAAGKIIMINATAARLLDLPQPADDLAVEPIGAALSVAQLPPRLASMLEPDRRRTAARMAEREVSIEGPAGSVTLLARASDIAPPGIESERGGMAAGRLLVLTDITELTRTIQMKTDFVANASHELRTPLTAIRTAVDTLLTFESNQSDPSIVSMLGVIDRHSERLNAIVGDLLDLSRIESGRKRYDPEWMKLSGLVAELHARFAERLSTRSLDWRVDIAPDADDILVNKELLLLVLDNLVDNAIKFTDIAGYVAVSTRREDAQISIRVADNGCGIPDVEQDRVFERFYQVERARSGQKRGTGLGLAIVRHATGTMNGNVRLSSAPGEGTRIDLVLPAGSPQTEGDGEGSPTNDDVEST